MVKHESTLNGLLALTIMAYRRGKLRPITMSAGASGALYNDTLQALIQHRLPAAEHALYVAIRDACRRAVTLAQRGLWPESAQCFRQVADDLQARVSSPHVWLLGQGWLHQGQAYLASRLHAWERARAHIQDAMAIDQRLEEQEGYDLCHIQRVHLLHLLVRIEAGAGQYASAIDLAEQASQYLAGERDDLPFGTGWSKVRIANTNAVFRQAMQMRLASEVGTILARQGKDQARLLWSRFRSWRACVQHTRLTEIYEWGQATEAFLSADTETFLQCCQWFLAAGRRETTLWYTTVLDLCACCCALRPAQTAGFREEVAHDARQWKNLPAALFPASLYALFTAYADASAGASA